MGVGRTIFFSPKTRPQLNIDEQQQLECVPVRQRSDNPKEKVVNVPMTLEQYERIRREADRLDVSMASILRPVIREWFEKAPAQ